MEKKPSEKLLTIHLRNGTKIECTKDHLFPIGDKLLRADELAKGIKLEHIQFIDNEGTSLGTADVGWIVGFYLAEGSYSGRSIQFSMHTKELEFSERLKSFALKFAGDYRTHSYGNKRISIVSGKAVVGVIQNYIDGYGAGEKHLSQKAFCENNWFLASVLDGYLDGDGYYEKENKRWRIGFKKNREFEYDLRVICNRLGYFMRAFLRKSKCNGKDFPAIKGEIRKERTGHFNQKDDYEILRIIETKGITYEIEVDGDHLFALCDGTLVHNCMPSSIKDRFTVDFEPIYFFVKQGDYWFEQQKEPYTAPLDRWGGDNLFAKGESTWDKGTGQEAYRDRNMRPDPKGRNRRCVWDICTVPFPGSHFAVFPPTLIEPMLAAGCPEFVCNKCGKAREKIYKKTGNFISMGGYGSKTAEHIGLSPTSSLLTKKVQEQVEVGYTDCGCNAGFDGGWVLDPFCGSGTVGVVAEQQGKNFIGIELNPEYIDMATKRIYQERQQLKLDL